MESSGLKASPWFFFLSLYQLNLRLVWQSNFSPHDTCLVHVGIWRFQFSSKVPELLVPLGPRGCKWTGTQTFQQFPAQGRLELWRFLFLNIWTNFFWLENQNSRLQWKLSELMTSNEKLVTGRLYNFIEYPPAPLWERWDGDERWSIRRRVMKNLNKKQKMSTVLFMTFVHVKAVARHRWAVVLLVLWSCSHPTRTCLFLFTKADLTKALKARGTLNTEGRKQNVRFVHNGRWVYRRSQSRDLSWGRTGESLV